MKQHRAPIAAGIALVLILAIWYVALWVPAGSRLKAARASEAAAAQQVATDQAQLSQLQAEKPQVAHEEAALNKLVAALPNGPSLDQIFVTVNAAATRAHVVLSSISTPIPTGWGSASGGPAPAGGPETMQLNIGVSGTPGNILRFVSTLDAQARIYVVSTLQLSPLDPTETATLNVETFFQSAVSNDPTFPGESSPPTTAPTATTATTVATAGT